MISLLSRLFIKDSTNFASPAVRRAYGVLCSVTGIALNVVLFLFKYIAGMLSGAISITADAFNNLSDAGSSLITLIGFHLSGAQPDKNHPFGHGRIEYLSGLIVSFLILLMGFELGKSSIEKIISPSPVTTTPTTFIIVAAAIVVKLYMFIYNNSIGKKINSPAMRATAFDSISDTASTAVVFVSMLISHFTSVNIDGWCGILVALFIFYTGIASARDTISPLLGQPPEDDFVQEIKKIVLSHEEVVGIHDLIVHDYGPGRLMISLHAEVPDDLNINILHEAIDEAEAELVEKLHCAAVIHMDPISVKSDTVVSMRAFVTRAAKQIDESLSVHDFRMVIGVSNTNLLFDVVVPFKFRMSDSEIQEELKRRIKETYPHCTCIITIDKPYA